MPAYYIKREEPHFWLAIRSDRGGGQEGIDSLPVALDGECRFVSWLFVVFGRTFLVLRARRQVAPSFCWMLGANAGPTNMQQRGAFKPSFVCPEVGSVPQSCFPNLRPIRVIRCAVLKSLLDVVSDLLQIIFGMFFATVQRTA